MARPRWASALEVLGFYGSILLGIWIGQRVPIRLPVLATGVVFLALCSLSNHFHRDSREKIGLAATHFKPCAKLVLKTCTIPLIVLAFFAARQPLPFAPKIFFGLLIYPVWAFAQDYALLSFSANRLMDVIGPRPWAVAVLNGILFSLVHMPNPPLVIFTFAGGIVFTRIFFKTPHLVPIAIAHAWTGFLLSVILQSHYNAMMIGPAYLTWAGIPGPHP